MLYALIIRRQAGQHLVASLTSAFVMLDTHRVNTMNGRICVLFLKLLISAVHSLGIFDTCGLYIHNVQVAVSHTSAIALQARQARHCTLLID